MGTPAYVAPEMIAGNAPIDGRADLYGLGCVGSFLLTATSVFKNEGLMQLMVNHLRAVPEPPSRRSPHRIPESLERLILQCLEKDPARRPQTPDELAERLAACELATPWSPARARAWWDLHQPCNQALQPSEGDALLTSASTAETQPPTGYWSPPETSSSSSVVSSSLPFSFISPSPRRLPDEADSDPSNES